MGTEPSYPEISTGSQEFSSVRLSFQGVTYPSTCFRQRIRCSECTRQPYCLMNHCDAIITISESLSADEALNVSSGNYALQPNWPVMNDAWVMYLRRRFSYPSGRCLRGVCLRVTYIGRRNLLFTRQTQRPLNEHCFLWNEFTLGR
jgi:hypothetical protein